jgi:hypothetical protein
MYSRIVVNLILYHIVTFIPLGCEVNKCDQVIKTRLQYYGQTGFNNMLSRSTNNNKQEW